MFQRLDDILNRYQFLAERLASPDALQDMELWQKYSKEQADLTETAEKYQEYLSCKKEMDDAFLLAEEETDGEMKKMLLDEGYACKERLQELKDELKILLLPKDHRTIFPRYPALWKAAHAHFPVSCPAVPQFQRRSVPVKSRWR